MKTMFADFNAMTDSDRVSLATCGSKEDVHRLGIRAGDWVWLTDSELVVGAQVDNDPYYGLVGITDWDTLVHLDTEEARDITHSWDELQLLLQDSRSAEDEARLFELLTQFDHFAPQDLRNARPGYLAFRRASALHAMGKFELALVEIEEVRSSRPASDADDYLFLEILRRVSPARAIEEAEQFAESDATPAVVLAAAINILAERGEDLPDDQFETEARRVIRLCERFEYAPNRTKVTASLLSLVHFNKGMILLRLGSVDEAHTALGLAHAIEPLDEAMSEATHIAENDPKAREIASRVRSRPRFAA